MCPSSRLLLVAALACGIVRAQHPAPRPATGDLARIAVRVASVAPQFDGVTRITVEVRNPTPHAFEPFTFLIKVAPHGQRETALELVAPRAPMPFPGRAGRPVPPGGRRGYELLVTCWELPPRLDVSVRDGAFYAPEGLDELLAESAPVAVGALRQETFDSPLSGGTAPRTVATLRNLDTEHTVDAVLRARVSRPRDGELLFTVTLAPGEEREHRFEDPVYTLRWIDQGIGEGVRIDALEVIDWTLRFPVDEAVGEQRFLEVYRRWARWQIDHTVRGRFRLQERRLDGEIVESSGGFVFRPPNTVKVEPDATANPDAWTGSAIRDAFRDLLRPAADELAANNRIGEWRPGWFRIEGPGWRNSRGGSAATSIQVVRPDGGSSTHRPAPTTREPFHLWRVEDGAITGEVWTGNDQLESWRTSPVPGGGFAVVERHQPEASRDEWRSYGSVDGVPVPATFRQESRAATGELSLTTWLQIDEVELVDAAAGERPAPTGPGADALRAVWDGQWSYPDEPVTLRARFEVRTPGTDGVWVGQRRVRGELTLHGFRGFRSWGGLWRRIDVVFDGELPAALHPVLASALQDRLLMWAGRDLAGRGPFHAQLAGATVAAPSATGRFALSDSPYAWVEVDGDRIAALGLSEKLARRTRYKKFGDALVPVLIETGDEELRAKWRTVDGHVVPVEFDFRRVFGSDWGPERITLSKIRIEPGS